MANNNKEVVYPDEIIERLQSIRQEKAIDKMSDMAKYSAKGTLIGAISGYIFHRVKHTPMFISILGGSLLGGSIGYIFSKGN